MFIDIHAHAYRSPSICMRFPRRRNCWRCTMPMTSNGFVAPIVNPEIYFPRRTRHIFEMVSSILDALRILQCGSSLLDELLRCAPVESAGTLSRPRLPGEGIMPTMPMRHPIESAQVRSKLAPVTWDNSDQRMGISIVRRAYCRN